MTFQKAQPTRHAVAVLIASVALAGTSLALAQDAPYPSRTIMLVMPAAPGGTTDISARMLADPLGKALGQSVIVDNKGGGNGAIAALAVKRADPSGYTLLMQYSGYHVITPHVSQQKPQWSAEDFRPVANVLSAPQVIVVREGVPAKSLAELIAYAKANPGKLTYASSGNGSLRHVTGPMLEQQAGIQLTHVPYKGTGAALQDLLGGQVDMTFGTPPPFMQHILGGKLRALAVTGKTRLPSLPNVPTAAEAGMPKLDATSWFAVFAPAKTPQLVIDRLSSEIAKITGTPAHRHTGTPAHRHTGTPAFQLKAAEQGAEADHMDPKKLADFSKAELERWGQVVKAARIEAE